MIRKATIKDSKAIAKIYNYYVETSIATFTEEPICEDEMITAIKKSTLWYVFEENDVILGYAYASKWKSRSAYKFTVESSIYLNKFATGKGIGTLLYEHLLKNLKKIKIHSVIGGVSLPNKTSVRLHEKFNFRKVAHFTEVGFKFNKWIDVGYWELIFK